MSTPTPANCLGAGRPWRPGKAPGYRNRRLRTGFVDSLRQSKFYNFRGHSASLLQTHHDVARFDIPVNELLLVNGSQTGGDLPPNFQHHPYHEPNGALDKILEHFALFRRIEVVPARSWPNKD